MHARAVRYAYLPSYNPDHQVYVDERPVGALMYKRDAELVCDFLNAPNTAEDLRKALDLEPTR